MNILLADDHHIVRQGMQFVIEDLVEDVYFYHASSIQQIRDNVKEHTFDLAVLDAQLPDGNCLSILSEMKTLQPNLKILVFTSFDEEQYSLKFIHEGANGFLSKLSDEEEIKEAISQMINEGCYYPPLTQAFLKSSSNVTDALNPINQLSERELEIALLYARGDGNLEIANKLDIKQNTVSTYKKRIFEKLGIDNLVELIELIKEYHHSL